MKLSYLQQGFGTQVPLVLLHPFPLNAQFWSNQLSALSKNRHVIAMNLRGFGSSHVDSEAEFTIERMAQDVINTMRSAQLPRAVFAGCSMGGYVLFELWRRQPEIIAGMILADTRAEADTDEVKERRRDLIELVNRVGSQQLPEMAESLLSDETRKSKPGVVATARSIAQETNTLTVTKSLAMMAARPDSTTTLHTINVPSLVIVGENDKVTPIDCAQKMHSSIPSASMVVVPEAGHLSPLESPQVVNAAIGDFLAKVA